MQNPFEEIIEKITAFKASLQSHMPALEGEVNHFISTGEKDNMKIERMMDILIDVIQLGAGEPQFIRLLEYYKTINPEGAARYWEYFEAGYDHEDFQE